MGSSMVGRQVKHCDRRYIYIYAAVYRAKTMSSINNDGTRNIRTVL